MNELLNIISASDKRRNLLILLTRGPHEWDDIKRILNVTSTGMLPQIKILEEEHLIGRDGRKFFLTPIGKVLATQMDPLIRTMEVLERNKKFWHEHDLSVLPHEILLHIGELGDYQIIENPDVELFDVNTFLKNISTSTVLKGISHTVHPRYPSFFLSLAKKGVGTSLILTPEVFRVIKEKYRDMLEEWLECKNAHLFVPHEDIRFSFVVTDTYFSISLFYTSGAFDSKNDCVSFDPSARVWGNRIFDYFLEQSEEIKFLD
jgi:predicted transcriptional regulator